MKSPYAGELVPNQIITTSFLVHVKEIRQKKGGEYYLSLLLGDRTGDVDAKMWDNVNDVLDAFDRDDFVKVKGLVQVFHNRTQLTIHKLRRLEENEVDVTDYFPASKRDPGEMWRELQGIVSEIANPHLKALLNAMFADEDIAGRYRRAPAAKQIHHAFLGGLIEHVLSVSALAKCAAAHYPGIDRDLLLTGVLLHDIGKIYELNYERGFSYSTDGQLLGHIAIASRMLHEKLRGLPDFPPKLRALVEHLILSHHGKLEFGSPKTPSFPEALLLHYLDDMDSKMECMRALIEQDPYVEGCFTGYSGVLDRVVLKKDRYLNPPPPVVKAPRPVERAPEGAPLSGTEPAPVRVPMAEHPRFAPKPQSSSTTPAQATPPIEPAASPVLSTEPAAVPGPPPVAHPLFAPKPVPPDNRAGELQPAAPDKES
jgi:3'-5' exoribonuclease